MLHYNLTYLIIFGIGFYYHSAFFRTLKLIPLGKTFKYIRRHLPDFLFKNFPHLITWSLIPFSLDNPVSQWRGSVTVPAAAVAGRQRPGRSGTVAVAGLPSREATQQLPVKAPLARAAPRGGSGVAPCRAGCLLLLAAQWGFAP